MPPFSFSFSQTADPQAEEAWRPYTYLQYLGGLEPDVFDWSLAFVQNCRFAASLQPQGWEVFAGRAADIGVDRLGLDQTVVHQLLYALAGVGVQISGADYMLRVCRPWCTVIEPAAGADLVLPDHWLEGVELYGDPHSIWIGRRVSDQPVCPGPPISDAEMAARAKEHYQAIDWSLYEESRFGWKLRSCTDWPTIFEA